MKNVKDDRFVAYFVWLPVINSDDRQSAVERSAEIADQRVRQYWDAEGLTGNAWKKTLNTEELAWDVYLIYGPGANWENDAPLPDFWMHQLMGIKQGQKLDQSIFESKVKEYLNRAAK